MTDQIPIHNFQPLLTSCLIMLIGLDNSMHCFFRKPKKQHDLGKVELTQGKYKSEINQIWIRRSHQIKILILSFRSSSLFLIELYLSYFSHFSAVKKLKNFSVIIKITIVTIKRTFVRFSQRNISENSIFHNILIRNVKRRERLRVI